jgi:hypothetical protein
VAGKSVLSYNSKKNQWGWKVVSIIKVWFFLM